ncbi:MAG: hypothetical protein H6825_05510 [Planctomycetes bacterium]|nr:hypothetical protein [Planctomycetota bacterium]
MSPRPIARRLALVLALSCGVAHADVLVVDPAGGPGSDFTSLMLAIDSAADGDVLLLRGGAHDAWNTIDARSLTLVGDGPFVQIAGQITVTHLAPQQAFVLRDVTFQYPGSLELSDNDGPVLVDQCTIRADLQGGSGDFGAIHAVDSRVVVRDSLISGSAQYLAQSAPPTVGIHATNSTLLISGSTVLGGDGIDTYGDDVPAAAGMRLEGSHALVDASLVKGGTAVVEPGGPGLVLASDAGIVLRESAAQGGDGSPAGDASVLAPGAAFVMLPGVATRLSSSSPVREGASWTVDVTGEPGDGAWLVLGVSPAWASQASGLGVFGVGAPFVLLALGPLGPSGQTGFSVAVPELGVDSLDLWVQAVSVPAGGGVKLLTPPAVTTLLDGAY